MWKRLHVKHPLYLSDFNETWISSTYFQKTQISNFIRIRPIRAELFHAGGQKDRRTVLTKLIVAFRDFANAPKKKEEPWTLPFFKLKVVNRV